MSRGDGDGAGSARAYGDGGLVQELGVRQVVGHGVESRRRPRRPWPGPSAAARSGAPGPPSAPADAFTTPPGVWRGGGVCGLGTGGGVEHRGSVMDGSEQSKNFLFHFPNTRHPGRSARRVRGDPGPSRAPTFTPANCRDDPHGRRDISLALPWSGPSVLDRGLHHGERSKRDALYRRDQRARHPRSAARARNLRRLLEEIRDTRSWCLVQNLIQPCPRRSRGEKRVKRWRRDWKLPLIEAENPQWRDLSGGAGRRLPRAFVVDAAFAALRSVRLGPGSPRSASAPSGMTDFIWIAGFRESWRRGRRASNERTFGRGVPAGEPHRRSLVSGRRRS